MKLMKVVACIPIICNRHMNLMKGQETQITGIFIICIIWTNRPYEDADSTNDGCCVYWFYVLFGQLNFQGVGVGNMNAYTNDSNLLNCFALI